MRYTSEPILSVFHTQLHMAWDLSEFSEWMVVMMYFIKLRSFYVFIFLKHLYFVEQLAKVS